MLLGVRCILDVLVIALALAFQSGVFERLFGSDFAKRTGQRILFAASAGFLFAGLFLATEMVWFGRTANMFAFFRASSLSWAFTMIGMAVLSSLLVRTGLQQEPADGRRRFLRTAARAVTLAPAAVAGFGVAIGRSQYRVTEVAVPIANLHPDLNGLRIVQISDVHLGPFLSESEFARVIDMANETKAQVAVATGDLISQAGDPLNHALRQLARLRSDTGIFGCHGNHEHYAGALHYCTMEGKRLGIEFLRHGAWDLKFGQGHLRLVGVDYQSVLHPYLQGTDRLIRRDATNLLLSHNPDVFPVARRQGFDLTLAGHTHGGQVNFEILDRHINVSRLITPYTQGLYREEGKSIYVTTGVGTIGVPVRFGAPPEVALIRLCAT